MPKKMNSDALWLLNRMLGLAGPDSGAQTELDSDRVDLVVDIGPVVRRSLALAGSDGIFWCYMENSHAAGDDEQSVADPYAPVGNIAPYPNPVPNDLEFWLLSAGLRRSAGAGGLTDGALFIAPATTQQGWGVDDGGAAVVSSFATSVARFDAIIAEQSAYGITEEGNPEVVIGRRLPRGTTLVFQSTSAAAADFQAVLMCALMPLGFGQDVLV